MTADRDTAVFQIVEHLVAADSLSPRKLIDISSRTLERSEASHGHVPHVEGWLSRGTINSRFEWSRRRDRTNPAPAHHAA